MNSELKKIGHPMLATLLTVSLSAPVEAEIVPVERALPRSEARLTDELELIKEEESVSIASRYEQPISQAASNVYVITDEDIRQSGATDIPTVLRRIPGMEVMQVTGADFNISVRGDNQLVANKLLVMVDGRSVYLDVQGTVFWKLLPVTLPEIKRIEVLKGPASAIYGFNAFDGIINIITKSPGEMKGTTLQFGGGEFGTISSAAIHGGTIGRFGYRLSIGRDQTQQWRNREALAFRDHKFNVQADYDFSHGGKLSVSGGLVDSNRFDGHVAEDAFISTTPSQGYANVTYQQSGFLMRAFWNRYSASDDQQFNPLLSPFLQIEPQFATFSADTYNVDLQHSFDVTPSNKLTYGANYRHNTLSSDTISAFSRENRFGLFLQDEWRMTQSVTFVAGARYDLDTFIQPTVSPRVAILFSPSENHTFRVSGSVAYRPPTLFEKKADEQVLARLFPAPPTAITGGANAQPEQIISYDLGYQGWFLNHRLRVRVDAFFNHISDLISVRNQSPLVATFANDSGSADIYGGEAGIEFLAAKWLTGFANYSYQKIGQTLTGRVQRGGPRSKFNIGFRAEAGNGLSGEAWFHHYGGASYPRGESFDTFSALGLVQPPPTRIGSYSLLNLRGGYKFWKQKAAAGYLREAEVAVSAFNALNDQHKEHPLGDTIGSRVMGWVTVKF